MDRRVLLGFAGLAGVAALAKLAQAGPLEPPAGPVSPTGATLSELNAKTSEAQLSLSAIDRKVARTPSGCAEPRVPITACPPSASAQFVITQPGAYYLPSNLQQQPGLVCIDIQCSDVDIDGQGFTFQGSPPGSPPASCVRSSGQSNIELYDCAFVGWQGCPCDCDDCDDVYISDVAFRRCTCPPGFSTSGVVLDGAMIRCRDRCEIDDVSVSECSGGAVKVRDKSTVSDVRWSSCTGRVCICQDHCCIESLEIVDCAMTAAGSSSGGMLLSRDGVIHRDLAARMCTCPAGFMVSGSKWVCEDICLTNISGDCVVCADACCVRDIQISSCAGRGITCATGACVEDVSFHNHQGDCVSVLDNGAVCDIECRSCTGVAITCGAGACVEECAVSSHTGDCVRCADGSCVTETECRNVIGIAISVGRSSIIEDCDVSGGGGGGSYRCADGSCVRRSRSHSRDASMDIAVTDRCSVEDCCVVSGQGISVGSSCTVSCNELRACSGGPDSTAGFGGAIIVAGAHTCVEENVITDCRIGISVRTGGDFCSVDDNHVSSSIGGIAGGAVAGIVVAAAVSRVMCTCNHLRVGQGATPFVAGASSFGPIVVLPPDGGDISLAQASSHHLANFIIT